MQPDATGEDLRRRREALRISQRGIGERAGLDAATVRRVERDAGSVRSSSVGLYLRALEDAEAAMTGRVGSPATNPSSGKPQEKPPVSITVSGPDGLSVTVSGAIEHLDVLGRLRDATPGGAARDRERDRRGWPGSRGSGGSGGGRLTR
ncbi:helix-turn-helix domain-containing protein [Nocardioides pakistanensis]